MQEKYSNVTIEFLHNTDLPNNIHEGCWTYMMKWVYQNRGSQQALNLVNPTIRFSIRGFF